MQGDVTDTENMTIVQNAAATNVTVTLSRDRIADGGDHLSVLKM